MPKRRHLSNAKDSRPPKIVATDAKAASSSASSTVTNTTTTTTITTTSLITTITNTSTSNTVSTVRATTTVIATTAGFPTPKESPSFSKPSRFCPLPNLSWADSKEVWQLMLAKDKSHLRNPLLLHRHPGLQPRMRSILLDWLTEVCEVYRLHRETNYLALDFIDRYLSSQTNVSKSSLQLIGITCLFIAAKVEEIYPPKLSEFAYVTDDACREQDITAKELVILKTLNWDLCPMTINSWLCVYMQLFSILEKENNGERRIKRKRKLASSSRENEQNAEDDHVMTPIYSSYFFAQIAHLVDLCVLDIGCLRFPYNTIAASALYHFTNEEIVNQCTSLTMNEVRDCVMWMTPFAMAIKEEGLDIPKLQKFADSSETLPNIQSHTADLNLLEKAQKKQEELDRNNNQSESKAMITTITSSNSNPSSPVSSSVLTPPRSNTKCK